MENSPVLPSQRIPIIDILRGWALLSVVIMNYITVYGWNRHSYKNTPGGLTSAIENVAELVFGGNGFALLALLFGYGFSVIIKKVPIQQQPNYKFFIRRMLWLFVFAFINTLLFGGDILNDYAFMGLLLLLFYNFTTKKLFVCSVAILLLTPFLQSYFASLHILFAPKDRDIFYSLYNKNNFWDNIKANLFMRYKWLLRLSYLVIAHLIQLGCFILGAALQQSNLIVKLSTSHKRYLKHILVYSLVMSVVIYFSQMLIEQHQWRFNDYYNLYYPQILFIMICTTSFIIWLYSSEKLKGVFSALQVIGKMTLTNYMLQSLVAFILFIQIRVKWDIQWYVVTALLVYGLQIAFSKWWLNKYNYGLMEWAWRCLTYRKMFDLKKNNIIV